MRDPRLEAGGRFVVDEAPPDLHRSFDVFYDHGVLRSCRRGGSEEGRRRVEGGGPRVGCPEGAPPPAPLGSPAPLSSSLHPPAHPGAGAGGPERL
eukprot:3088256-Alexandrium_andersonii.AAC.1